MSEVKNKPEAKAKGGLSEQMAEQAKKLGISLDELKKLGISLDELKKLAVGKKCPKYGTTELLHTRRNRSGNIMVFNISERFRGEKISEGRKLIKSKKQASQASIAPENKE